MWLVGCQGGGGEAGFHNDEGVKALSEDRYDAARMSFERALELAPKGAVVWGNLGVALTRLERYDEALSAYQKAAELEPGESVTVAETASIQYRLGHYAEAETGFRKAQSMMSKVPEFKSSLGLALLRQGKTVEADAKMAEAVTLAARKWQNHGLVKYQMAAAAIIKGHVNEGLDLFAESLTGYPAGRRESVSDPDFNPVHDNPRYQEQVSGWWKAVKP